MKEHQRPLSISPEEYLDLFGKAMKKLEKSVEKEMGEERFLIYFEQLHKYTIEEIQDAVDQAIHDQHFSLIMPVGKLIWYIEQARLAKREQYQPMLIDFELKEKILSREEGREEAIKALNFIKEKIKEINLRDEAARKIRWEQRRKILKGQKALIEMNQKEGK